MDSQYIAAMVLQTAGIVAGFFMWIRKIERDVQERSEKAIEKAIKDQGRLFEKIDELKGEITEMKLDTMRQFHSISQSLLRMADKLDFSTKE